MRRQKPSRDLVSSEAERLVAELCEEFDGDSSPFFIGSKTQQAISELLYKVQFYRERCNELQRLQREFRDPERSMVCDVLANGYTNRTAKAGEVKP